MSRKKYIYWLDQEDFKETKRALESTGLKLGNSLMTPCQTLQATDDKLVYAGPEVWSRVCARQGSWYRNSDHKGQYLLVSQNRLPEECDRYLDAEFSESDFQPSTLPTTSDLEALIGSEQYNKNKPREWEAKGIVDAVMFKILFTLTRFWGFGENLKRYWLSQRANHANFLAHRFTAEIDGQQVPYSIAENKGICSSCVEMFNVIDTGSRKLVRACPGAVTFGGAKRDVYYDIKPVVA